MNERGGFYKARRAAFVDGSTHWLAKYWRKRRRFSQWEALTDLIERAAFTDYTRDMNGQTVLVPRGHVVASSRGYAKRWGWEQSTVHRFLSRLESDGDLLSVGATPGGTLYRLTWYELDQGDETAIATPNATGVQQACNDNKKGRRKDTALTGEKGATDYPPDFEQTWSIYPQREGGNPKPAAFRSWSARLSAGVTSEEMHAGTVRFRAYHEAKGNIGTSFVMQGSRFYGRDEPFREAWAVSDIGAGGTVRPLRVESATDVQGARSARDASRLAAMGYPVTRSGGE